MAPAILRDKHNIARVYAARAGEYDAWYDRYAAVYKSEVEALRAALRGGGRGLEVGVGTGRFASLLGIKTGVEPCAPMAELARKRGVKVFAARAEKLPFKDGSFGFVLMFAALCFVRRPAAALKEARRVIKPGGRLVLGIIDKGGPLGAQYWRRNRARPFYKGASPHSAVQAIGWLKTLGFGKIDCLQTVFDFPENVKEPQPPRRGHGEGLFAVISGVKRKNKPRRAGGADKRKE